MNYTGIWKRRQMSAQRSSTMSAQRSSTMSHSSPVLQLAEHENKNQSFLQHKVIQWQVYN